MNKTAEKPCLKICAGCPWLKANHGQPHPAKWYSLANLRRLWNGLRTGKAPGIICHATDPNSTDYGSTVKIKDSSEPKPCGGALLTVMRHVNEANRLGIQEYIAKWGRYGLNLRGLRFWVEQHCFGMIPAVENRAEEVAAPDEQKVQNEPLL